VYDKVEMKLGVFVVSATILLGQSCLADWTAGSAAFQDGNYRVALQHFEAEIYAGLDGPAVHYNVAVCHFKLQQYEESRTSFRLIANQYPKMRGLAEYNLGLIERRKNDTQAATSHFLKAYELSPIDQKLRILASARLRELEPELRLPSKWTGALGMRAGFDDNVALRDETGLPSTVTTDSPFADFFASIKGPYNGVSGFRFDSSIYVVRNIDADDFDQAGIYGGAMYVWRPGEWRLQMGIHGSAGTLGGDSFDRKAGGNFRAVRYLNENAEFDITYVYDDVQEANTRFAGIAGSRQQLQGRYRWYSGGRRFVVRLRQ
jgi:tetratricopeptide (TPR) repeat protein